MNRLNLKYVLINLEGVYNMDNKELTFWQKFARVQYEISVEKDKDGSNGHTQYKYRDKEAIIFAVKKVLNKYELIVYTDNEIIEIGGKIFVQTKATVTDGTDSITAKGWALMEDQRIQGSKLTGSTITYSERYALAALFLVCDHTPNIEDLDNDNGSGGTDGADNNNNTNQNKEHAFDKMNMETDKNTLMPIYTKYVTFAKDLNQEEKKILYKIYKKYMPSSSKSNVNINATTIFSALDPIFDFDNAQ